MPRNDLIQVRSDTSSNWNSVNPTLATGEIGFESNTGKFKIGTGSTVWSSLSYNTATTSATDLTSGTLNNARLPASATTITTVGTLGSLEVTGNLTVNANVLFVDTALDRVGIGTATPSTALQVVGTVTATAFAGSGASLTLIPYTALTGTVPTWNQNTTGTASTVTGAAQTAITSVGTLSALGVTGTVTAGAFSGPLTGNVTGNVTGSSGSVATYGATVSGWTGTGTDYDLYVGTTWQYGNTNLQYNNVTRIELNSVGTDVIGNLGVSETVTATNFAISTKSMPRGVIGYQITTTNGVSITTEATQLSFSITAVAGRVYRITYFEPQIASPATAGAFLVASVKTGATKLNGNIIQNAPATSVNYSPFVSWTGTLTAGTQTISGTLTSGSGTFNVARNSTSIGVLTVEDLGTL
jgi:hypothetical protein